MKPPSAVSVREPLTKERLLAQLHGLLLEEVRGPLGNLRVRTTAPGEYVCTELVRRPPRKLSAAERAHRRRFQRAIAYATKAMADPRKRRVYEAAAAGRGLTAHNLAMKDYFTSPVIEEICASAYTGRPGEQIFVYAAEPFEAARTRIVIRDRSGNVLETGCARGVVYTTRSNVPSDQVVSIEATITDLAGNSVRKIIQHELRSTTPALAAPRAHCRLRRRRAWFPEI